MVFRAHCLGASDRLEPIGITPRFGSFDQDISCLPTCLPTCRPFDSLAVFHQMSKVYSSKHTVKTFYRLLSPSSPSSPYLPSSPCSCQGRAGEHPKKEIRKEADCHVRHSRDRDRSASASATPASKRFSVSDSRARVWRRPGSSPGPHDDRTAATVQLATCHLDSPSLFTLRSSLSRFVFHSLSRSHSPHDHDHHRHTPLPCNPEMLSDLNLRSGRRS